VEAGATKAASPKEVAIKSDVVITSLRDDIAVLDVVSGEEGILSGFVLKRLLNENLMYMSGLTRGKLA
jgi:3-hydroxyisobutyrate dehydrogenase-like beta-hydroxyacid dehydrogenase